MSAPTPEQLAHYIETLRFGLVHIPPGTKGPRTNGWQDRPVTTPDEAARVWEHGGGVGLHHGASGTAVLDIDHPEWAALALAAVDIDLEALLTAPGPKIRGKNGLKPVSVYLVPEGVELSRRALSWKPPDADKAVTVLELRAGLVQDVLPPSIHPDTGEPYTWEPEPPLSRDDIPELPGCLRAFWENWGVLKPVLDKAQPWNAPPPPRTFQGEGDGVIGAFNTTYAVQRVLEDHGYTSKGLDRYLSPHSSTGLAGVTILKGDDGVERAYSHHASDPLADEHAHDAFSAWCILACGGDIKAAVREAAQELGMSHNQSGRTPPFVSSVSSSAGDTQNFSGGETEDPWEPLGDLPGLHPPVPALPPELIPEPLRPWLVDIAERTSLPLEFVACPALVALGAVIGRGVGIHPKRYDDWLVVPNLWGGVVGRPGLMKTAAISEATKPLRALAVKARERYQEEEARAHAERARLELEIAALKEQAKRDAKKGGIRADFDETLRELNAKLKAATVTERRYMTQDPTTEKLGELLRENPRGLLVARDELAGWLGTLERPGREGDREFYLEGWNGGGSYTFDRIGRGTVHIDALTLSILGGVQPGKLERYLEEAIAGGGGADGLLQRFQLVVWPGRVGAFVNIDRWPDGAAKRRAYAVFEALDNLDTATLGLDAQEGDIPALRFSDEAQALFDTFREELEHRLRSDELAHKPAFESHLSKYRSLMPALALVFHLVAIADGTPPGPVSLEAARRAAAWCEYLEAHALKLYSKELSAHLIAARALLEKIDDGSIQDGVPVRDIYRKGWEGLDTKATVMQGLEVLAEHHFIRTEEVSTGGRPTLTVRLHPELRGAK